MGDGLIQWDACIVSMTYPGPTDPVTRIHTTLDVIQRSRNIYLIPWLFHDKYIILIFVQSTFIASTAEGIACGTHLSSS